MSDRKSGNARGMQIEAASPEKPIPLFRDRPAAEPMDTRHLGPLGEYVEAVAYLVQAPVEIAAQSVLAAVSLAVQPHRNVDTLGGPRPISLHFLTVAQSGERKSACSRHAMQPIHDVERERLRRFDQEHAAYKEALERARASGGDFDVIEREGCDGNGRRGLSPPVSPKMTFDDVTIEGLVQSLASCQPSVGLFSDEGGKFFGGHSMKTANALKTGTILSTMWDGSSLDRTRVTTGCATLLGRRVSVHLMVQPRVAEAVLADPDAQDQGVLARFLIAHPESLIGTRVRDFSAEAEERRRQAGSTLERYRHRMAAILASDPPTNTDDPQELDPQTLKLSQDALDILYGFSNSLELAMGKGGAFEEIRPQASKAAEQAARLAAIFTLYVDLDAQEISGEIMTMARELATWYLYEALRLLNVGPVRERTAQADQLKRWLSRNWQETHIDVRTIVQRGPGKLRDTHLIKRLVEMLVENGWLVRVDGCVTVNGARSSSAYRIVRDV